MQMLAWSVDAFIIFSKYFIYYSAQNDSFLHIYLSMFQKVQLVMNAMMGLFPQALPLILEYFSQRSDSAVHNSTFSDSVGGDNITIDDALSTFAEAEELRDKFLVFEVSCDAHFFLAQRKDFAFTLIFHLTLQEHYLRQIVGLNAQLWFSGMFSEIEVSSQQRPSSVHLLECIIEHPTQIFGCWFNYKFVSDAPQPVLRHYFMDKVCNYASTKREQLGGTHVTLFPNRAALFMSTISVGYYETVSQNESFKILYTFCYLGLSGASGSY